MTARGRDRADDGCNNCRSHGCNDGGRTAATGTQRHWRRQRSMRLDCQQHCGTACNTSNQNGTLHGFGSYFLFSNVVSKPCPPRGRNFVRGGRAPQGIAPRIGSQLHAGLQTFTQNTNIVNRCRPPRVCSGPRTHYITNVADGDSGVNTLPRPATLVWRSARGAVPWCAASSSQSVHVLVCRDRS